MIRKVLVVLTAAVSAALFLGAATSASAGTLDQQQTTKGGGFQGITTGGSAQTFTAGITGRLDQVDLDLETSGNTTDLTVEIRNEIPNSSGGAPGDTVLARQGIPGSAVPSLDAFVPDTFSSPAAVTAGTQYTIVAYTSGGALYKWAFSPSGDPYAGGSAFSSPGSPPAGPWTSEGRDFAFKTYVIPNAASPTGQRAAALKKCKKKHSARARKKCRKKAMLLPV